MVAHFARATLLASASYVEAGVSGVVILLQVPARFGDWPRTRVALLFVYGVAADMPNKSLVKSVVCRRGKFGKALICSTRDSGLS